MASISSEYWFRERFNSGSAPWEPGIGFMCFDRPFDHLIDRVVDRRINRPGGLEQND